MLVPQEVLLLDQPHHDGRLIELRESAQIGFDTGGAAWRAAPRGLAMPSDPMELKIDVDQFFQGRQVFRPVGRRQIILDAADATTSPSCFEASATKLIDFAQCFRPCRHGKFLQHLALLLPRCDCVASALPEYCRECGKPANFIGQAWTACEFVPKGHGIRMICFADNRNIA